MAASRHKGEVFFGRHLHNKEIDLIWMSELGMIIIEVKTIPNKTTRKIKQKKRLKEISKIENAKLLYLYGDTNGAGHLLSIKDFQAFLLQERFPEQISKYLI
ncbi:hypothetical protein BVY03_00825 [bacterium K02(2017)]|nr:hypothetical protein BVY03_00825 [bacterium K02(2017)]